ncbi:hypothetical protein AFLA_007593 [Aspergillus flavus NRRL3357]|nr:hypothetical protein AFLA_007593 [Aspergillus flavus NRRL3357]
MEIERSKPRSIASLLLTKSGVFAPESGVGVHPMSREQVQRGRDCPGGGQILKAHSSSTGLVCLHATDHSRHGRQFKELLLPRFTYK